MASNATKQRAEALLYWINTFPLDTPVESLQQLNDGQALAKVLADIDPSFRPTDLRTTSSPTNWVPRWENLKLINKALNRYTREECYETAGLALSLNLKRIAEDADVEGLVELLSIFLLASVSGPKKATYIPKIEVSEHAATFASIILEKQEQDNEAAAGLPADSTFPTVPSTQGIDIDLAIEERYGELVARNAALENENKRLKTQNADLLTRLDKLEESNDDLKTRYVAAEDKATELSHRLDISSPEIIKHLEDKIREQDILIGTQEKQIEDDGNTKTSLQRELNVLRNAAENNKALKVQVEEQKHEIDDLSKKANAMERYKQKIENQKHLEPENSRLKEDLNELSHENARLQKRVDQFEAGHSKYQGTLERNELELFETRNQKKMMEYENRRLEREVSLLKERQEHDSAIINELQEKVAGTGSPANLESPVRAGMNLQAEIEEAEGSEPNLEMEIARLRQANELLQGGANAKVAQEKFDLALALSEANRIRDLAEKKYQIVYEDHVILQERFSDLMEGRAKEGFVTHLAQDRENAMNAGLTPEMYSNELDKSYKDLSTRLVTELQEAKKNIADVEVKLSDKRRELSIMKRDLSMVNKEELEKVEVFKLANAAIVSTLEADYQSLHARYQALLDESAIQKAQLTEALLSKDKIRNERDDLLSTLQASKDEAGILAKVKEKEEHIKTQSSKIKDLQDRLKSYAEGGRGNDLTKTEKDDTIVNLKRELTLMTTAWYDLTTRIQSNNVVLQRRGDAPKSWINKQRQAALGVMPRR